MRRLTLISSLFLLLLSSPAFAFASPAGKYAGTWSGAGGQGDFKIALAPGSAQGEWTAEVSFTLSGQEVKCKTAYIKIDGTKLEVAYDFSLGDLKARSTIVGQINGSDLSGDYTTKGDDGSSVDAGTWKASLVK
jgi:hypothetical protein